jgi:ribosomal-protein-alanine N-acetyltransferase
LQSKRLGFCVWTEDDFHLALDLWGDNAVTKLIGGPFTTEKIQERFSHEIKNMKMYDLQYWPIFLLETEEHIGCCGFRPYDIEKNIFELGFHIRPKFWRQGFAREAADTVILYAFSNTKVSKISAGHHPENVASSRLLEQLGFQYTHHEYYPPTGLQHPSYILTKEQYCQKTMSTI